MQTVSASNYRVAHRDAVCKISDADMLVRTHTRLVKTIARSIFTRVSTAIQIEDLEQIGLVALIRSARVFEMRGVAKFSTYASSRIRGAMIDELRHSATISRRALSARRVFAATDRRLEAELGRPVRDNEMANALGIAVADYRKAAAATAGTQYQSIEVSYSDTNTFFADPAPDAFVSLERDQMRAAVASTIGDLPKRWAMVLQLYFVEELGLAEIGEKLGVSAACVCQIKKRALEKVRAKMVGWM